MDDKTNIRYNVIAENDLRDIKARVYNEITPILKQYLNKKVLKSDGSLIKVLRDDIIKVLDNIKDNHLLKNLNSLNGRFTHLCVRTSLYSISIFIGLSYPYVTEKEEIKYFTIDNNYYICELEGDWKNIAGKRINPDFKTYGTDVKHLDAEELIKQYERAKKLQAVYNEALDDIKFYKVKQLLTGGY
jgi:hypothetical protein